MPWCASAPHHVTSIFLPVQTSTLLTTGSIGVGLAVEPRLTICSPGGERPPTTTAERALRLLGVEPGRFRVSAPLPPARGYAVSASSAVTAALTALRGGRKVGVLEALQAAHKAEVLERTGLGDVLAISCGIGLVLRLQAGAPGVGKVECVPMPRSLVIFSLESLEAQPTSALLRDERLRRARSLARALLREVFEERTLEVFIGASMRFTKELCLHRDILGGRAALLDRVPGIIGYYAKKRVVLVIVEEDRVEDAREDLLQFKGVRVRLLSPSEHGVRVWWDRDW